MIFISLEQKKLESQIKVCEKKDFCNVVISFEDTKIFNQYCKFDKARINTANLIKHRLLFMQIFDL